MIKIFLIISLAPFITYGQLSTDKLQKDTSNDFYYSSLKEYLFGVKKFVLMPFLIQKTEELNNKSLAEDLCKDYIDNYILKQPSVIILSRDCILFLQTHIQGSRDEAFHFFMNNQRAIDSVVGDMDFTFRIVSYFISRDEIDPIVMNANKYNQEPDWTFLRELILKKYAFRYIEPTITDARLTWLAYKGDWTGYCANLVNRVLKYGPFAPVEASKSFRFNWNAWDLFKHAINRRYLREALKWSDSAIKETGKPNAEYIDTYANILYRLGRKQDAIIYESQAAGLSPLAKDIEDNLLKMKRNRPTWVN